MIGGEDAHHRCGVATQRQLGRHGDRRRGIATDRPQHQLGVDAGERVLCRETIFDVGDDDRTIKHRLFRQQRHSALKGRQPAKQGNELFRHRVPRQWP